MYREDDEKNPLSVYGEQKSMAEEEVLKIYGEAIVFRLPLMFGNPAASASNYLQKFMAQIKNAETVKLFHDEYRSMGGAKSIAEGILHFLNCHPERSEGTCITGEEEYKMFRSAQHDNPFNGILHLAGKEKLSRYQFGQKAAATFDLEESLLLSCSQKNVKMAAPRPADVSLDISKALRLGFAPLTVADELKLIADEKYF